MFVTTFLNSRVLSAVDSFMLVQVSVSNSAAANATRDLTAGSQQVLSDKLFSNIHLWVEHNQIKNQGDQPHTSLSLSSFWTLSGSPPCWALTRPHSRTATRNRLDLIFSVGLGDLIWCRPWAEALKPSSIYSHPDLSFGFLGAKILCKQVKHDATYWSLPAIWSKLVNVSFIQIFCHILFADIL